MNRLDTARRAAFLETIGRIGYAQALSHIAELSRAPAAPRPSLVRLVSISATPEQNR